MVVNFRACGISRDAHKLAQTPTLITKKKKTDIVKIDMDLWLKLEPLYMTKFFANKLYLKRCSFMLHMAKSLLML